MGSVIVITSGKGGVGKSTVTACLGRALCTLGKTVVLIDMDAGLRSLDLLLDMSGKTLFDLSDILEGRCSVSQAVLPLDDKTGLFLVPATVAATAVPDVELFRRLCGKLAEIFDYVLLDSPAGIGRGFEHAVAAADNALVVVTPDPVSVRDGAKVAALLRQRQIERARLVINKIQSALILNGVLLNLDEIIDAVGLQLIAAIPNDDAVICAGAQGEPLPECYAARGFMNLAKRMENQIVPLLNLKKIC